KMSDGFSLSDAPVQSANNLNANPNAQPNPWGNQLRHFPRISRSVPRPISWSTRRIPRGPLSRILEHPAPLQGPPGPILGPHPPVADTQEAHPRQADFPAHLEWFHQVPPACILAPDSP
ncbi:Hypothetical predicted protein, partial [Podarcis lilfordi]